MNHELEKILEEHNVKSTVMRLLVLEKLSAQSAAISLSDLEDSFERSDRVTLYRTLKTFEQHGLVHTIDDGTGVPKYALCSSDCNPKAHHDTHVHFHCTQCNTTHCLPDIHIPELELPDRYQPQNLNLVIQGICAGCS